jgi:hypothetical protein
LSAEGGECLERVQCGGLQGRRDAGVSRAFDFWEPSLASHGSKRTATGLSLCQLSIDGNLGQRISIAKFPRFRCFEWGFEV